MDPVSSTIVTAGAQAGFNTLAGSLGGRMSYKKSKKLAEYAYSKDLEMWNRMNEYNLPINQMKRLDEAGLNPNMMYGTGQGANMAKEMPKFNAPTARFDFQPVNVMSTLSQFQDMKVKQAQVDNIKESTNTRKLENSLREGQLYDRIDKMRFEAQSADAKRVLDNLKLSVEQQFQDNVPESGGIKLYGGTEKRMGELGITQEAVRRTKAEADIKEVEAGIYTWLKKNLGGENADVLAKLVQMILLKL